jgi:hypothetical protein
MTTVRNRLLGFLAAELVMMVISVTLWIQSLGGLRRMYDDDSYPVSLFMLPATSLMISTLFFVILVLPIVQLAR